MAVVLYGIANCDTVKKARAWLTNQGIEYQFHDFRQDGLERAALEGWVNALGVDPLLNKRSTTWRQLSDADKSACERSVPECVSLMLKNPTLIKRPVLVTGRATPIVGFKAEHYLDQFPPKT